jgi:thiol:disulfide interchange protein DsbC
MTVKTPRRAAALLAMAATLAVAAIAACCPDRPRPEPGAGRRQPRGVEAALRKSLAERIPTLPKIDEISKTPIPGLYEIRIGHDLYYSDEKGDHLIVQGSIIDTRTRTNLTEARIDKLTAIEWDALPLKDAMVIKQGTGQRKLAVFVDPNCGYCKRFERDLLAVKDVTIYTFLYPILGPTPASSRATSGAPRIRSRPGGPGCWTTPRRPRRWAAATPPRWSATSPSARSTACNGTPALFFEDGSRKPGALPGSEVERLLAAAARKS